MFFNIAKKPKRKIHHLVSFSVCGSIEQVSLLESLKYVIKKILMEENNEKV